jgi:hypothetical protein
VPAAQRWSEGAVVILVVLAAVSCDGRGSDGSTPTTAAARMKELAPANAQVVEVTSFDGDRVTLDVDVASGRPPTVGPPLVSYRELCGDLGGENFGLDHPRLRVRWRSGGDDAGSVVFGDRNFSGGGVYARREGSPCINLVTVQTVRDIARMAGPGAAAPFEAADRATPDVMKTDSGEQIHPWVAQARWHEGGH